MKSFRKLVPGSLRELKTFFILWSGQSVSQLGSAMSSYALIIWAYQQQGTVLSVALLSVCTFLPHILVSIFAGALVDRLPKKTTLLFCDAIAACCTLAVLLLFSMGRLELWLLYVVNLITGLMNSFQSPASNVTVTLVTPQKHYGRASGLQSLSESFVNIFSPVFATALLAFGGLSSVLIADLLTFAACFLSLWLFVRIPKEKKRKQNRIHLLQESKEGFSYLNQNRGLLYLMFFLAGINLLAALSYNSVLPAMLLSRQGGGESVLGLVTSAIGVGGIVGGVLMSILPPPKNRVRTIFIACAVSMFTGDIFFALGRNVWVWAAAAFVCNIPIPILTGNQSTLIRLHVPSHLQGRVYSIQTALQFGTIPAGYLLGGILADYLFEPMMRASGTVQSFLSLLVGTGPGSGMAVIFLFTGVFGTLLSLVCMKNPTIRNLEVD